MEIFKSDDHCVDTGGAVDHIWGGMQVIVAVIISRSERLGCVLRSSSFAQGLYGIANPSEVEK